MKNILSISILLSIPYCITAMNEQRTEQKNPLMRSTGASVSFSKAKPLSEYTADELSNESNEFGRYKQFRPEERLRMLVIKPGESKLFKNLENIDDFEKRLNVNVGEKYGIKNSEKIRYAYPDNYNIQLLDENGYLVDAVLLDKDLNYRGLASQVYGFNYNPVKPL